MYKYLFGPVPSRRLGMSLGVDLVPHKVCSLNCIYCECGRTTELTVTRNQYVDYKTVTEEIADYLSSHPAPDYITFSGSGEPTLNSRIGDVLRFIKQHKSSVPVAVLTSGTLFTDPQVRSELLEADLVLPSLDAAEQTAFLKINRPHRSLNVSDYVQSLADFRQEFQGKIWLEILILPGINDDTGNLDALKDAILTIKPDEVQLNTLDRPGTVDTIRAASRMELQLIAERWNLPNIKIISSAPSRKKIISYRKDTESAIMETIARRPCTLEDLHSILGLHINEINKYLDILDDEKQITATRRDRGLFYQKR